MERHGVGDTAGIGDHGPRPQDHTREFAGTVCMFGHFSAGRVRIFGHDDTGIPQFFLGGPSQWNAYGTNELRTNQYWLARVGYVHELFSLPPLLGYKTYFTSAYELGQAQRAPGVSRLPNDGSLGLVAETLIGPLFVGGSVGDSGHRRVYFSLGRFF